MPAAAARFWTADITRLLLLATGFGIVAGYAGLVVSYAAGSRYMSLLGGVCMSFYDWYCDLPPASPQTWGEQTDVPESADWYNAGFIIV